MTQITEERKAYRKAWHAAHKDEIKAISRAWYAAHKEEQAASMKAWDQANRDKVYARQRSFMKTEKGKLIAAKKQAKRKRDMGYLPLNKPFAGSEGHHIDSERVIYIPKYIHRMFKHNHRVPESMLMINAAAFAYLEGKVIQVKFI